MPIPTKREEINAAKAAVNEYAFEMKKDVDDMDVMVINLLVSLRFMCDDMDINYAMLDRQAGRTFMEERAKV